MTIKSQALLGTVASLLTITAAISAQAGETSAAQRDGWFFKPYAGADVEHQSVDYKTADGINYDQVFAKNFVNGNIHVGARVHKNLGVEVGYSRSTQESKDISQLTQTLGVNGTTDLRIKGFNMDVLGYYPLTESGSTELIGTVGVARLKAEATYTVTAGALSASAKESTSDTAWRVGTGVQQHLTDNLSARGMVRYNKVDFGGAADGAWNVGLGLNYQF